jgi:hypothetical protein
MNFERLRLFSIALLSFACATPSAGPGAAPATKRAPVGPMRPAARPGEAVKPFPDLLDDESPVGYEPNARGDTPECRALFAEFNKTWAQAGKCERDADCALAIGSCTAARADLKSALQHKLEAVAPCVNLIAISSCLDTRVVCFEARCRVRGRIDKGS